MTIPEFLLVELVGAVALVAWVFARYPKFGPRSIRGAIVACLGGLAAPKLGLAVLPLVERMPGGLLLALFGVVLPVFVAMFLTIGWLMRACAGALGGPRGGHPVHDIARSRS